MLKEEKRSEYNNFDNTNNLEIKYNFNSTPIKNYNETVELKKIKELLCEEHLEYVTDYLKNLLDIKKTNNPNCFKRMLSKNLFSSNEFGKRVIIYVRLSVEDINKADGDVSKSILNQLLMLLTYCYEKQLELVGIFYEEDISGSDESRPEWNKSLLFCELGNTDLYVCKTQARFARDVEMIEKYLHKRFVEWKVRFISIVDHSDTASRGNKLQRQITAIVDENKLSEQSINTKATLRAKNSAGQWTGSFAPYGYIEDPNDMYHFVIDDPAAKIVREIYEMYANGFGYSKICTILNERQVPTPSRYKKLRGSKYYCPSAPNGANFWTSDTVRKILLDETYDGVLIQHRTESISYNIKGRKKIPKNEQIIIECSHERIVDPNISLIVRKKFKERKEKNLLEEARYESNILISIIEEAKSVDNTIDKKKISNINYLIMTLKESLLTSNVQDIIEKYNDLREMAVMLSSDLCIKIQDNARTLSSANTRSRPGKDGKVHIFSQKVYCKCCGKAFQKNKFSTGPRKGNVKEKKDYLVCKTRKHIGKNACENKNSIRFEVLEEIVLSEINKMINRYFDRTKLEESYYEKKIYSDYEKKYNILIKEKSDIEKQINSNNEKFTMLYNDRASGLITPEEFIQLKNGYHSENKKLEERVNQINFEIVELEQKKDLNGNEKLLFEKYKNIKKLDRLIVDTFISKIIIGKIDPETKKRDIKIIWNIAV